MSVIKLAADRPGADPGHGEFTIEMGKGTRTAVHLYPEVRQKMITRLTGRGKKGSFILTADGKDCRSGSRTFFEKTGFLLLQDGHYENLSVKDHLLYFRRLYSSALGLEDAAGLVQLDRSLSVKVRDLTHSEKLRLRFGTLLFQAPALFILEEPDQNIDLETKRILVHAIEVLQKRGKTFLTLTGNMESAFTFGERVYRLSDRGLVQVITESARSSDDQTEESAETAAEPDFQFNKIPAKVNEKILLFDPPDIDYIESHDGQSHIYSQGESYPCVFTLTELEDKLRTFGFFRCHRSYIVNLQKVSQVITWTRNSYSLRLENRSKSEIPLSKNKMADLKAMLGLK
ncbi:LytTR family transcriptional regulator DNA-binding domain-containing protein [Alteribacter natronophilus]|uniref:LytTR family transcriptional regulator DNA-binding domain-containing protein n=1 Tax=Alteribacter natronophilus TaxID=2583810 RepID=UPI001486624F|nr:LytTR family transcriptional regulator DNA-binding domain-containing protein [Alteribacter natronophilus]